MDWSWQMRDDLLLALQYLDLIRRWQAGRLRQQAIWFQQLFHISYMYSTKWYVPRNCALPQQDMVPTACPYHLCGQLSMIFAFVRTFDRSSTVLGANETFWGELEGGFCYKQDDASHSTQTLCYWRRKPSRYSVRRCDYKARDWNWEKAWSFCDVFTASRFVFPHSTVELLPLRLLMLLPKLECWMQVGMLN